MTTYSMCYDTPESCTMVQLDAADAREALEQLLRYVPLDAEWARVEIVEVLTPAPATEDST